MDPALGQPQHGVETGLAPDLLVQMHETMLRTRLLEERLIRMVKQGDGYFWIGGPGEEAFNVPLGMLVHKGEGPAYDYLHLHYRSSGTLLAMGAVLTGLLSFVWIGFVDWSGLLGLKLFFPLL